MNPATPPAHQLNRNVGPRQRMHLNVDPAGMQQAPLEPIDQQAAAQRGLGARSNTGAALLKLAQQSEPPVARSREGIPPGSQEFYQTMEAQLDRLAAQLSRTKSRS